VENDINLSAVPVIKTVLQFAANRIVFNPMEAMNMAVASEGMMHRTCPPSYGDTDYIQITTSTFSMPGILARRRISRRATWRL
jgi:hypothetical protein